MKDITNIKVVVPKESGLFEKRISDIFVEEVSLRGKINAEKVSEIPETDYILITNEKIIQRRFPLISDQLSKLDAPGPEGFRIIVRYSERAEIIVAGADDRGAFYGMARVLRKLYMKDGKVTIPDDFKDISVTPEYDIRGHQLAYRDHHNTCPAWDVKTFDRYIRDLAFFGANSIEILPPKTDDYLFSDLFVMDPFDMMIELSRVIHSYGMDVWVWYPLITGDYRNEDICEKELKEWEKVFSAVPYVDAVLIPAGDPGEFEPNVLFSVTSDCVSVLHKYHPDAKVWIAPQVFEPKPGWYEAFYEEVAKQPEWLYGVSYAPWIMDTIEEMYNKLPQIYKDRIRHYPDITHNTGGQFQMPNWHSAFALTLGREGFNTRPKAMKYIHNKHAVYTMGSITYSEGIHDDINKMVWADQDFDSKMLVEVTIKDYVRLFIDPDIVDELTELILKTEENWVGSPENNNNIDIVYHGFLELEKKVCKKTRENYRFQMALLRAMSDYYAKIRFAKDQEIEKRALEKLSEAKNIGADTAIRQAQNIFKLTFEEEPVRDQLISKMQMLSDSLYEKCRIRLTTSRHKGRSWVRGAYLDSLNIPLNDYQWYTEHLKQIIKFSDEKEKLIKIDWLLNRTNSGAGSFYDWLGDLDSYQKRVVSDNDWKEDPGFLRTPVLDYDHFGAMTNFYNMRGWYNEYPMTLRWVSGARVVYGTPLIVKYNALDPKRHYKIRITYLVPSKKLGEDYNINLYAGDCLIHSTVTKSLENPYNPVCEYKLPKSSYGDGNLILKWQSHGEMIRFSVSEIWIIKE